MAKQAEAAIVRRIKIYLQKRQPEALVWKLADRFTRGLPDILFIGHDKNGAAMVVGIECKTKKGHLSALQKVMCERFMLLDDGRENIMYTVATSLDEIERFCDYYGV